MESSRVETATREIYCSIHTPLAETVRSSKPTAYERYRDYHTVFPQPTFEHDIVSIMQTLPTDLLLMDDFKDTVFADCAALAVCTSFLSIHGGLVSRVVSDSAAISAAWCPANGVFFSRTRAWCNLGESVVACSTNRGVDVVFTLIAALTAKYPDNNYVAAAWAAFHQEDVDASVPMWGVA